MSGGFFAFHSSFTTLRSSFKEMDTPITQTHSRFPYVAAVALVYLVDQMTKHLATGLSSHSGVSVIEGFFRLTYVENAGIAWGLFADVGAGGKWVLGGISLIAATGIVLYAVRTPTTERLTQWGLALVLGGVLGNLTDRIIRGAVVDFLDFNFGSYRWPTFNVADAAITVGAIILIVDALWSSPEGKTPDPRPQTQDQVQF
jgi:signal peptidase II